MTATSLLRWADTQESYDDIAFRIGSQDEDGTHRQDTKGWPYSIYRRALALGKCDVVICRGIQNLDDAEQICERLDCFV